MMTPQPTYEFRWHPSEDTDPNAPSQHPRGTYEEANLCATAYQARIDLIAPDGSVVATVARA